MSDLYISIVKDSILYIDIIALFYHDGRSSKLEYFIELFEYSSMNSALCF